MKILLVTNPSSGAAADHDVRKIARVLGGAGAVLRVEPDSIEGFEDAVVPAAEDRDLIVTAGGDGTMNCTVNALSHRFDDAVFGLIPMGTGNDLARTLGIPEDPLEAARSIVSGVDARVDVGRAAGAGVERLFVNACMGGFPVQVDEALVEEEKERLGPAAFIWGGVKALADLRRSTVSFAGVEVGECVAAGVGNGRTAGGGIAVWPDADPGDGLLDVCALSAPNTAALVKLAAKLKLGSHADLDEVATGRARSITLEAEPSIELNVDGELVGLRTPATFEVVSALRMRVPRR